MNVHILWGTYLHTTHLLKAYYAQSILNGPAVCIKQRLSAVGSTMVDCAGDASSNPSINKIGLYTVIN